MAWSRANVLSQLKLHNSTTIQKLIYNFLNVIYNATNSYYVGDAVDNDIESVSVSSCGPAHLCRKFVLISLDYL